jgi:histidine triad (HIT) family protein
MDRGSSEGGRKVTTRGGNRDDCDFCAIARGEDSSVEIVCEGADWVAFFPIDPATPGHTLVIPRSHVANLWEARPSLAADLMAAVVKLGNAIEDALQPEGMNLITSAGRVAEQTVFHLHLHVVPRWARDGFGQIWPRDGDGFSDSALEAAARRIREKCREG